MTDTTMTLDRWRALTAEQARGFARRVADQVGAQDWTVECRADGPARALFRVCGQEFALVPGGAAELGFDPAGFRPAAALAAAYARSGEYVEPSADLGGYLAGVLSPWRAVELPSFLMSVDALELPVAPGRRLPTPDEWEYACGAGARSLFRWGDTHPATADPFSTPDGPQQAANAFGLRIGRDPYQAELTSDPGVVLGGDGGEATCGGYGGFRAWLPLATAYRDPYLAELLGGGDPADCSDELLARAVIDL
ncbi:formylglycine-generating enzyme family protein [Kitasatospora sp. NBC_00374]|uniref:SUMF1/EgtB/PvdO family nonheme iron enzyme n=1 Tax=Kitasatospora sp. NBC_00374 TaxID=2975964 RepID=UPI0030E1DEB1